MFSHVSLLKIQIRIDCQINCINGHLQDAHAQLKSCPILQCTIMDGQKSVHSLIGGLARTLRGFSMPKSSVVISQELKKLSDEIKKEKLTSYSKNSVVLKDHPKAAAQFQTVTRTNISSASSEIQLQNSACSNINSIRSNMPSTPSCSTAQSYIEFSGNHIYNHANPKCSENPSTGSQSINPRPHQAQPNTDSDILYQPESLLKLLSDDTDLFPHSSVVSREFSQDEHPPPSQEIWSPAAVSQKNPTIIKIPEYIKAPARIFPVVIGQESYALPYQNCGSTVVVIFNVVHAAGEFVVAKITGCTPYDNNIPYPEGIILSLTDEIKVIPTKKISEMTIDEQLHYHKLKVSYYIRHN